MKTTLNINDALLAQAKSMAVRQQISVTRLIEEGLQLRLRSQSRTARTVVPNLPVIKGRGGLMPGIDPTSNKSLLEAAGDDT